MVKRKRKKHQSHKRSLNVCNEHRPFLETTPGGKNTLAKLEGAVAGEAAGFLDQADSRFAHQTAAGRCQTARGLLQEGVRHATTVSIQVALGEETATAFGAARPDNDEGLIAAVNAIHADMSAHADLFVNQGVHPTLLDTLANEVAALERAKGDMTAATRQFTEATERLDQALDEGDEAIAVLEGIFATWPGAPVGALAALRQAKRIGPRVNEPAASSPAPSTPPAAPAVADKVAS